MSAVRTSNDPPLVTLPHTELDVRRATKIMGIDDSVMAVDCGAVFGTRPTQQPEQHRYVLWRMWSSTVLPLVVIGLNPSTATEMDEDRTINKCLKWALRWGHGGLVMLNLFSYRSKDPKAIKPCHLHDFPEWATGGWANDQHILWHAQPDRASRVLAGWGTMGALANRGRDVAVQLEQAGIQLWCTNYTAERYPKHPLYELNSALPERYVRAA